MTSMSVKETSSTVAIMRFASVSINVVMLIHEVEKYFRDEKTWDYQSFQAIGYKEWKEYFLNQVSLEEVKQKILVSTRQYAKRQLTWFRHQFSAYWYKPNEENEKLLLQEIEQWLKETT